MTPTSPLRGMAVVRRVVGVAAVVAFGVWLAGPRPGGQAGVNHADGPAVLYELSFPEPEHRWMQVTVTVGVEEQRCAELRTEGALIRVCQVRGQLPARPAERSRTSRGTPRGPARRVGWPTAGQLPPLGPNRSQV